ncbi:MAG: RIP metalloprotease RseP [Bacilli bacterium]
MWFLTLLLLIFILGIIILVHELGHFLWAKKFDVYIYEFSIGMGPVIFTHLGKDKIKYNIRAVPIGGFVQMAGEVYEDDEKIDKSRFMCNKPWYQRIIILVAGVVNNFILAIILLFVGALIWGGTALKPVVKETAKNSPMAEAGIVAGDEITEINGHRVTSWDTAQIVLFMKNKNDFSTFVIKHENGKKETYKITPSLIKDEENKTERKVFGITIANANTDGFFNSLKYSFCKFGSIVESMWMTIVGLFTGKISINALSGPVGIYQVVGQSATQGLRSIIYIVAFLSLNVGFINILPFPAFDGGRIFFLIVEKIKGSPINSKFENICHVVGFALLILLMIYITFQDIIKLF